MGVALYLETADQLMARHGFRMEVLQGRGSVGADVTPLTPAAGAPHSDAFRVTTLASDSAWGRPIMDVPTGRHQKFSPSSRTTDKGRMTVRLLDEPLDPADQNVRWVTAFLNTPDQKDQLAALKVIIYETRNGGATWDFYFTGRVNADRYEEGTNTFRLDLDDMSGDLEFDIFVGIPHGDANNGVRYSYPQPCLPLGIPFDYIGLQQVPPMRAQCQTVGGRRVLTSESSLARARKASIHDAFKALADDVEITTPQFDFLPEVALIYNGAQCHVYVYPESSPTTQYGPYPLRGIGLWEPSDATDQHYRAKTVAAEGFVDGIVDDASGASHPALTLGQWYYYRIVRNGAVDATFPLLVGQREGIHPIQYMKDICQGYFGRINPDTGAPAYSMPIDETAFDAMIADPTWKNMHDMPSKVWSALEYIEDVICVTSGCSWRLDAQGRVVPIDLRLTATSVASWLIAEGDLTDNPEAFQRGGEKRDAITRVNAKYYVDQQLSLDAEKGTGVWTDVPATYIEAHEVPIEFADFTPKARDIGDQPLDWDAQGIRLGIARDGRITTGSRILTNTGARVVTEARVIQAIAERRRPFRSKPNTYTLEVDRTAAVDAIVIGTYGVVQADQMVDPSTHERGGARLCLCISVEVLDAVTAKIEALDVGPVDLITDPENPAPEVTEPPELDNYQVNGSPSSVQVDVTLNAAGDFVAFRIAETSTAITDVNDVPEEAWAIYGFVDRARTVTFASFAGPRVWLQGRSEPGLSSTSTTLPPSVWVSPLNAEYVDLDVLDPPTSPAVADVTDSTATFSWIPAAGGYPLQVWYGVGTLDGTTLVTTGNPIATLPPGSTSVEVRGLAGPSTAVTLGVRHVDPVGGRVSAFAFVNFSTATAGTLVAPRMAGIGLLGDA